MHGKRKDRSMICTRANFIPSLTPLYKKRYKIRACGARRRPMARPPLMAEMGCACDSCGICETGCVFADFHTRNEQRKKEVIETYWGEIQVSNSENCENVFHGEGIDEMKIEDRRHTERKREKTNMKNARILSFSHTCVSCRGGCLSSSSVICRSSPISAAAMAIAAAEPVPPIVPPILAPIVPPKPPPPPPPPDLAACCMVDRVCVMKNLYKRECAGGGWKDWSENE